MSDDEIISQLLDEWDVRRAAGREVDAAELCGARKHLVPLLRERIRVVQGMERALALSDPDSSQPEASAAATTNGGTMVIAASRYRILKLHARGGIGEVLLAEDEQLQRQVAIKRMQQVSAADASRRMRFQREALITGQLDHPGIVSILSVGEDENGNPCCAMKFIEGITLAQHARDLHEKFQREAADRAATRQQFESTVLRPLLSRFLSVCNTIAYAHSRSVIHRDIKPANVMLGDFGATYVVDWGLARRESARPGEMMEVADMQTIVPTAETVVPGGSVTDDDDANLLTDTLTKTGSVMGTPAFMSPEQATGNTAAIGRASDQYSLGATLWFLLTGRAAIVGQGNMNWLEQLTTGRIARPTSIQPLVPKPLESICMKAMALQPADRYASVTELAADLERWLADDPVAAHAESWSARLARFTRRHRTWTQATAIGLVLVTLLSGAFAVELNSRRKRAEDAEHRSRQLAAEKTQLAGSEAAARKIADEQSSLSLKTLRSVVFQISRELSNVEGASAIRTKLLQTAADGLGRVATTLGTRIDADHNLMTAHNDLGKIYMSIGTLDRIDTTAAALEQFQTALEVGEQLIEDQPDNDRLDRDMSIALELIGDARLRQGELSKADEAYARSLAISEQRLKAAPNELSRQQDTGFGYEKVADIRMARGDLAEAKRLYSRCLEIYQQIVTADPATVSYQRDLLVARSKMGNIQREERELAAATETFRECVRICESLEKLAGSDAERRDRSVLLNKLGTVLLEQGQLDEAASAFGTALQIARDALVLEPTSVLGRRDLTISLMHVGSVERKRGNQDASLVLLEECLSLRRTLASEDAGSQVAQVDVASVLTEMADINLALERPDPAHAQLTEAASILNALKDAGKLQGVEEQKLLERVMELQQ